MPVELAERAAAAARREAGADVVVCVGGGSATGLAKASRSPRPADRRRPDDVRRQRETPIWGLTGGRHKQTGRDPPVLPRAVIYDPELTVALPTGVTGPAS